MIGKGDSVLCGLLQAALGMRFINILESSRAELSLFPGLLSISGKALLVLQLGLHSGQYKSLGLGLSQPHLLSFFLQSDIQSGNSSDFCCISL